jgi:hypothetical protein
VKIHSLVKIAIFIVSAQGYIFCDDAAKGYKQVESSITRLRAEGQTVSHPHIPGSGRLSQKAQGTSTNWGGYAAAYNLNNPLKNSVSAVYGSWIVPSIKVSRNDTYCAIWIGIDGYRSSTVEQIGTGHDYVNGVAQHYAWFEMYPGDSYLINNFPVSVGDVISASVEYTGNNIFILRLYNDTKKVSFTVPTSYTTVSSPADRSSAEWIVEAPYYNGVLPLANFGRSYLFGCMANIRGTLAMIKNNSWSNIALTMVTNSGANKAVPSALLPDPANGAFTVDWKHQ